jgi:hypothetical protein
LRYNVLYERTVAITIFCGWIELKAQGIPVKKGSNILSFFVVAGSLPWGLAKIIERRTNAT